MYLACLIELFLETHSISGRGRVYLYMLQIPIFCS